MSFNKTHALALGMFLVALATQIGGLNHGWKDAMTPQFCSGTVLNLGSIIIAAASGTLFPPNGGK